MLVVSRTSLVGAITDVVCNYYGKDKVFPENGYSGLPKMVLCYLLRTCTSLSPADIQIACDYKARKSVNQAVNVVRDRAENEPVITKEINQLFNLLKQEGI